MVSSQRERAMQYLLGKLPEQEAAAFEEQCFLDDDLFEEMTALENDLLDSFVRGELPESEWQQFEKGYLISPARRSNLQFSRALSRHVSTQRPTESAAKREMAFPFFSVRNWPARLAWGAMVLMTIIAFSWITIVNRQLHRNIDSMRAQQAEFQRQQKELRQQIASRDAQVRETGAGENQRAVANPAILSLVLIPGSNRSTAAAQKLVITAARPQVKLQLYIEHDDYPSYRASVENAEGRQIWEKKDLKSDVGEQDGRAVAVEISSSIFKHGDYLVKLAGRTASGEWEGVEDYRFQVVTRLR